MTTETIKDIIGKTPTRVETLEGGERLRMLFSDGSSIEFFHIQDCCEHVAIEDVTGDWDDLIGRPLLVAEERSQSDDDVIPEGCVASIGSNTWTFYTFGGEGGYVDVRWHGSSNGFYSERVSWTITPASEESE